MWQIAKETDFPKTLRETYDRAQSEERKLQMNFPYLYRDQPKVMEINETSGDTNVKVDEVNTQQNSYQGNRNNFQGNRGNNYQGNRNNFQGNRQGNNFQNNRPYNNNNQATMTLGTEHKRTGTNEQILDLMERMKQVKMQSVATLRGDTTPNNSQTNPAPATDGSAGASNNTTTNPATTTAKKVDINVLDTPTREALCGIMDCPMEVLEIAEAEMETEYSQQEH